MVGCWGAAAVSRALALATIAPVWVWAMALLVLSSTGCVEISAFGGARQPFEETVVFGSSGPKLLLLDVRGVISDQEQPPPLIGPTRESTVARVREQLQRAAAARVRGVLLRVDTPGGSAAASDLVYREVLRFKQQQRVPVVAQFMGTATSGGYYVAMAADEIQSYPTSITGSIGVIMLGFNFAGLMEKLGIENQTITSGAMKDSGSPFRPMRPGERAYMQGIIDEMHARFREVVARGRPALPAERVKELSDGRVFTGARAAELGLVDRVGTIEEAVERLEELAGVEQARVVSYHRSYEWRQNLYTRGPAAPTLKLDLSPVLGELPRPGFHYLWLPAVD